MESRGLRKIARESGLSPSQISAILKGGGATESTIAALARVAPRTRKAADIAPELTARAPRSRPGAYSWTLESIRAARDDQQAGHFEMPVKLAKAMRTDDALFTAYQNRIAPISSVTAGYQARGGARGEAVKRRAQQGLIIPRAVIAGINGTLANHGIAVGRVTRGVDDAGARVTMRLTEWPLEHVRWNDSNEVLETRTRDGFPIPIVHGDGNWIVFKKFEDEPWTQQAAILPGSLIWAGHAEGLSSWAAASYAHGLAKILGLLGEGNDITDAEGALTPTAATFLNMLRDLASGDSVAGIAPPGSDVKFLSNGSSAWQVFAELILDRNKAAARVYQGTDAALGSVGGAPGVDISALFGVASTIVQGDVTAIEDGLFTGLIEPWCALNEGSSLYAPRFVFDLPDPDAEAKRKASHDGNLRIAEAIKAFRDAGVEVTQATLDSLRALYGVTAELTFAAQTAATTSITLAPTDIAKVIRVSEARASQGLPPLGDARDAKTLGELDAPAPVVPAL